MAYGKKEVIVQKHGDIIFFDWADKRDGKADHVGIVEKSENSNVFGLGIINYARGIAYKAFYPGMLN